MTGSDFVFDSINRKHKCNKINLNCCGLHINFPHRINNEKATINLKNSNGNNCFQYAVAVMLNHKNIARFTHKKNKPFINQYSWKEINLPSHKKDWEKFESNNKSIALNVL